MKKNYKLEQKNQKNIILDSLFTLKNREALKIVVNLV